MQIDGCQGLGGEEMENNCLMSMSLGVPFGGMKTF